MKFTDSEAAFFMKLGYRMGFMMDIKVGDLLAIPPVSRFSLSRDDHPVKSLRVTRLIRETHYDYDDFGMREKTEHRVMVFIAIDNVTDVETNQSYGDTYPCFIKTPETVEF